MPRPGIRPAGATPLILSKRHPDRVKVIVIEGAERLLWPRRGDNRDAVSSVLNIADGIRSVIEAAGRAGGSRPIGGAASAAESRRNQQPTNPCSSPSSFRRRARSFQPTTTMTTLSIVAPSALLLGFLLIASGRRRIRGRHSADSQRTAAEDLPDTAKLAGEPLRIVLSDHSGPGAVLRDRLMTSPSTRDP
jgi:hypothetical protein